MENAERETQFKNFAKLLLDELKNVSPEEAEKIIAKRAYYLVEHTLDYAPVREWEGLTPSVEYVSCIPDITYLPSLD